MSRLRVALVRGPFLNAYECQSYAPLRESYDITAFASRRRLHAIDALPFPVVELPAATGWPARAQWAAALASDAAARLTFGEGRYLPGLVERLRDFDIAHTVETAHAFSGQAVEARRRFGCRVVVTVWENIPFNRKAYSRRAYRDVRPRVLREADAFLAITERAREALLLEGADAGRIRVIPMGVDLERFRPAPPDMALRRRLGLADDSVVVLSVGSMAPAKGLAVLLHAVARARLDPDLRTLPLRVLLVGRDVGGARRMVADLGLADTVRRLDYVAYGDMPALYNLAALHVLPSVSTPTWQEQFGMVLLESLASGTAVLSTTSGSIPEVVGDAGVLVPAADHVSLYQAMKALLLEPARRAALATAGRRRAEATFDTLRVAKQIAELYESIA
ncbi:MAG TPA: glycosyltransferase family 4 protein [Methylomirabilota bacterium]|nr:glycosyltransferase family 4 protein [Methylomirabilota bacterium]